MLVFSHMVLPGISVIITLAFLIVPLTTSAALVFAGFIALAGLTADKITPLPAIDATVVNWLAEEKSEKLFAPLYFCLLYTSDAADERSSVDLGGRRII